MTDKIAFLGLGIMGGPMAGHVARAGYEVCVYNRTAAKARAWVERYGGRAASTAREAAEEADIVLACVGDDDDLRQVTLGTEGAFASMKRGALFVDHTTTSAEAARGVAAAARDRGLAFMDAPVSGGQAGAENGHLTIMAGGDEAAFERARPVLACYARFVRLMGPVGAGQLTKMVNQICIAGVVEGLAEGLHFARHAGLDIAGVVDVISRGAAGSWQMDNRSKTMAAGEFDFGFAVDWMRKDLGFCLDEARRNGAHLPLTALVDQFYAEIQSMGGGRWDTSSLIARLDAPERAARAS